MATVRDHYSCHLGPVYSWMMGGADAAIARGESELEAIKAKPQTTGYAVDLGAGFGMHAIPLARRGFSVLAVDQSDELLQELCYHAKSPSIVTMKGDLLEFDQHVGRRPELILCMGDTLSHLPNLTAVKSLFRKVRRCLEPGGQFVLSFRNYTKPLKGDGRFIRVRGDENRMLTCYLEYKDKFVVVTDLLYEATESGWDLRVSSYKKLRLTPKTVTDKLNSLGFEVTKESGLGGMIRLVATID